MRGRLLPFFDVCDIILFIKNEKYNMLFKKAQESDFRIIRDFYWNLIDEMEAENDKIGWKKGIYPTDSFLTENSTC